MHITALRSCFVLLCLVMPARAQTTAPHEKPAPSEEKAALLAAAQAFSTELRQELVRGLPSPQQLQRLSPLITPELASLIERARVLQQRQISAHPDEKPAWIEGDLFSSLFEGVTSWKLGEVFHAPTVDATVKVIQTYSAPNPEPVTWTDTFVFKQRDGKWLLDDIRMGGDWAFKSGASLRSQLPGGGRDVEDHTSLDERWQVAFTRDGDTTERVTVQPADKSAPPLPLFGGDGAEEVCSAPTWVVWSPNDDMIALRLGDGPRSSRTLLYRLVGKTWTPLPLPDPYARERKTLLSHGFRERDCIIDAVRWQSPDTLVLEYFGSYEKGDEGDGFHKFVSVRIDPAGKAKIIGAVDVPGED